MWEMPVHEFMPPTGWAGVTGLDYNIFCVAKMAPAQALALLKASLDLRFKGDTRGPANRAPFFIGGATHFHSYPNPHHPPPSGRQPHAHPRQSRPDIPPSPPP